MNKLSKKQEAEFDSVKDEAASTADAVKEAIVTYNNESEALYNEFNDKISELFKSVEEAVSDYNAVLVEAKTFCEDVFAAQESYWDDRSEKWQESERGQAHQDWASDWEDAGDSCDEIDLEEPAPVDYTELNEPDLPHDGLADLNTEFEF